MKRSKLYSLIACLFFALLFTACHTSSDDPTKPSQETPAPETTQTQELTDPTLPITPPTKLPEPRKSVTEQAQAIGTARSLYYIPNTTIEANLQQQIAIFHDKLLLWGYQADPENGPVLKVSLLSLEDGNLLHEITLKDLELAIVEPCDHIIAVTDMADGDVYFLDSSLRIEKQFRVDASYCSLHVSPDAKNVYVFPQNGGIRVNHVATGETTILLKDASQLFANNRCGNSVTLSYLDPQSQLSVRRIFDLTDGSLYDVPYKGVFGNVYYNNDIWLTQLFEDTKTYYLGNTEYPKSFSPQGKYPSVSLLSDPTRLLVTQYDELGNPYLTMYTPNGNFLSLCLLDLPGAFLSYDPVWSEVDGGYFFTVIDETGKDLLLFWDFSVPIAGADIQLDTPYQNNVPAVSNVAKAFFDRAAKLSADYDITIRIAEQTDTATPDFSMEQTWDENTIQTGLDALETVLSSYPKGFFKQLVYDTQQRIEVHLTGALTKNAVVEDGASGFTSFIGLSSRQAGKTVVAIDITRPGDLTSTMYHEFTHLIDYRMEFDASVRSEAIYTEDAWNALNPDDFTYAESYHDLPADFYNGTYEEWFIDLYSRTYADEDQARILEHAMMGEDWRFTSSPGRLAKLELLCKSIRDCFDTTGWPEMTVWEMTLNRCK